MSQQIQELDPNYKLFLDKSTLIFGETGTGKSFIITDILYQLQPYIEQIIVISPMDKQNHTYDRGIVPLPCIHYNMTPKLLDDIWERQSALVSVYTKANKPDVLRRLYDRVADDISRAAIESCNKKLREYTDAVLTEAESETAAKPKITEMDAECQKFISMIHKHTINKNRSRLSKMSLSKDEQFSLKFLNLNPRLALVLDDCTDLFTKFKSHPVVQKLFYQGRWAFITAIIACHTDKALPPELKKNAFVSVFTETACAHAYFERPSNDFDKAGKQRAIEAQNMVFTPLAKHQKLVWIREEKKFYKYTASPHPKFEFGSPYIWEFCRQIQAEADALNSSNKFIGSFV